MQRNETDLQSGIIDIEELLSLSDDEFLELRKKERPHPDVEFDRRNLVLKVHHGKTWYEIELRGCNDPAQILDWIFQLNGKTWMTTALMGQVVRAFDNACYEIFGEGIQGTFCPFGASKRAKWRKVKVLRAPGS